MRLYTIFFPSWKRKVHTTDIPTRVRKSFLLWQYPLCIYLIFFCPLSSILIHVDVVSSEHKYKIVDEKAEITVNRKKTVSWGSNTIWLLLTLVAVLLKKDNFGLISDTLRIQPVAESKWAVVNSAYNFQWLKQRNIKMTNWILISYWHCKLPPLV